MDTVDKGMIHVPGRDLIMLFGMAQNLKLMNCLFLEFSISYF